MKPYAIVLGALLLLPSCTLFETSPAMDQPAEDPWADVEPAQEEMAPAEGGMSEGMAEEAAPAQAELNNQRKDFLVNRHLTTAQEMQSRGQNRRALEEVNEALLLDPNNELAKKLFADISAAMGQGDIRPEQFQMDLEQRYRLRIQGLRAEALDSLARGRAHLADGNHEAAIQELRIVLNHVKWSPLRGDWQRIGTDAENLLAQAERARDAKVESARRAKEQASFMAMRKTEQLEETRKQALLHTMISKAIEAFDAEQYEDAVEICDRALELEPRSAAARDLRESAFKSARNQATKDYIMKKREQFARWQEDIAEARIPYTDIISMPDADYWNKITEMRAGRGERTLSSEESSEHVRLRKAIKEMTIPSLKVQDETDLDTVIGIIRTYTGLPIIVDPAASEAVQLSAITFNLPIENKITVKDALDIVMEVATGQIAYVFKHDAIFVTTIEKAQGKLIVQNHDMQDLVFSLTDFVGPNLTNLAERTSGAGSSFGDDSETPAYGGVGEEPQQIVNPEEIVTLIQATIDPESWDQEGRSIEPYGGNLVVVQTEEVQTKIAKFLDDLRRFSSSIVTIETKFLTVQENFLEQVGVEWRGLGGTGVGELAALDDVTNGLEDNSSLGLDNGGTGGTADNPSSGIFLDEAKNDLRARTEGIFDNPLGNLLSDTGGATFQFSILDDVQMNFLIRAVQKETGVRIVNSNTLSAHNGQRAYVTVINETSYIADYDVEVATAAFIANPVVGIIPDGLSLDVRPIIQQDMKYITLELQPTVATLRRPIQQISTTLAGISNPVTIQLPELQVSSAFTTATVPDGGSILIGGLKTLRNVERKSAVPWLADIPIIGILARTEGISEENESLMILIRAYITDVKGATGNLVGAGR